MSWQIKAQHVDELLLRHYIEIHDPETGAEHHVVIYTGHNSCPACGHVQPHNNLGEIDVKALVKEEIALLEVSRQQTRAHARKHGIPILKADGKTR